MHWHLLTAMDCRQLLTHGRAIVLAVSAQDTPFREVEQTSYHQYAVLHQASLLSNHAHNMLETIPALYDR